MTAGALGQGGAKGAAGAPGTAHVIGASSLGTVFEWYDFFLYGSLASEIAAHFFSGVDATTGFILALATFAVGFIVRPAGALLFGRIGDLAGRKNTFLVTLALMGFATFLVGALPGYGAIGIAAPLLLVALRVMQGLAIGGEFGGAITYVAEHAPAASRGLQTSFIPATALCGLLLSLVVIAATRTLMEPAEFSAWGWRIPFLASAVLLGISMWIRLKLHESPVFQRMKSERTLSRAPLAEVFLRWAQCRLVLVAIFGCVLGQAVTYYAGTFYPLFFLERIARVAPAAVTLLMASALLVAVPLTLAAGWLSDRIGRKPVLAGAVLLAALCYFPLYEALLAAANPALAGALRDSPVVVHAARGDCALQFDPLGRQRYDERSCDVVQSFLAHEGIGYAKRWLAAGSVARLDVGRQSVPAPDARALAGPGRAEAIGAFRSRAGAALDAAGFRSAADPGSIRWGRVFAILMALLAFTALTCGAYGALLVELFPARYRYTAVSFPQNVGNGWFGGLLPAIAFMIVAATGDIFAGLWYPVTLSAVCGLVALLALPETRGRPIH